MMTGDQPSEETIFETALEIQDAAQRKVFLDRACSGNSGRCAKIEKLITAHERAEKFFTDCQPALAGPAGLASTETEKEAIEAPGMLIGRYKLFQKIGEGGGGIVYMAEQQKPVRRRVALKIIKLGMDTKSVIARFEAERQALAMMDHPNIARVLDAGATETGRPYFVMELVNGIKMTNYCDEHQLDTRQRLDLFIQVCHAIQHAHQKGIIHRDIKPSNILVTHHDGVPVPKVIDFGIAKATQEPLTDKTLFTVYGHFIGTPAYMSPEQAEMSGLDVDTRSDIYSLGVLLYELLTGKTPFDQTELMESGLDEMRRTLREREPQRPSNKLNTLPTAELTSTALHRHVEPLNLQSLLRGDLDWIVMKALEKDRRRRYETANGLAMDVGRYLNNEPVIARPPSRVYRFKKLVRRNRVVFAAVGAVTVALVIGLGALAESFLVERAARQRAVAAEQRAELARANEALLRRQAEAREKMTQAALLVNQGKLKEADQLADQLVFDKPTLESAAVLRSLGEWHALQGRWPQAGSRFEQLLRVDKLDGWELASLDVLGCGVALAKTGDPARFEHFRNAIINRFSYEADPVLVERVLKASLLRPLNEDEIGQLQSLARNVIPTAPVSIGNARVAAALWQQNPSGSPRTPAGKSSPAPDSREAAREAVVPAQTADDFSDQLKLSDVGTQQPYSMVRTNGAITIVAGGADIWGNVDGFVYAHTLMAGDFDVRMRVCSISPQPNNFTRVGLMARESSDEAGSRHVMVAVNAENSFQVLTRSEAGAIATSVPQNPLPKAYGSNSWVRLQRVGAIFHAYTSDNGVDWAQLYQTTGGDKPFCDPIYVGMAACAYSSTAVTTNVITDLGFTPTVPVDVTVTLALLEYRRGDFSKSAEWCRRSLAYPEYEAVRVATVQTILAMACQQLARNEEARVELAQARELINSKFANDPESGEEAKAGWFDWEFAKVLLREATALIEPTIPTVLSHG